MTGERDATERSIAEVLRRGGAGHLGVHATILCRQLAKNGETRAQLLAYFDLLERWGARHDLMAARSVEERVDLALVDALVLVAEDDRTQPWCDVGTGAGAPGLVMALLRPELPMTLVEPRTKRVAFLRTVIGTSRMDRVTLIRARSDTLAANCVSTAVARATLPPGAWLREGARLATDSVWVLLAREEPPELDGWGVDRDVRYSLPLTGATRRAVRYRPADSAVETPP